MCVIHYTAWEVTAFATAFAIIEQCCSAIDIVFNSLPCSGAIMH